MAFQKNAFQDGDILYAAHVNAIEDVLAELVETEEKTNIAVQSNWNENDENSINHISGRPLWLASDTLQWNGVSGTFVPDLGYLILKENLCSAAQLLNSDITFYYNNVRYETKIHAYVRSLSSRDKILDESKEDLIVILADQGAMNGTVLPGNWVELQALFVDTGEIVVLGYYYSSLYLSLNNILNVESGLYVIPYEWAASAMATSIEDEGVVQEMVLPKLYGTVINLSYSSVAIDERYHNFFYGSSNTTNLHLITAGKLADVKFDQYNDGDVIVVYISNVAEVLG